MALVPPLTRRYSSEFHAVQDGLNCISSTWSSSFCRRSVRRFCSEFHADTSARTRRSRITSTVTRENDCRKRTDYCMQARADDVLSPVRYALESDSAEKHQKSLETYLESLHRQTEVKASKDGSVISEPKKSRQVEARKGLQSLERYIATVKKDGKSEDCLPYTNDRNQSRVAKDSADEYTKTKQKSVYAMESKSSSLFDVKDRTNLYLISILVSINIAVFLFEMASPIKNSDSNLWSLPLMYGAKVNDLIMVGEWWRLVTPMFLHAGLLHIGLSSWVLLSFGPQVCKGYGVFTFFLIYLLGGISGNFTSFLHTSEATVGGSGPVFAVIGAWLIYQAQNKDITEKENFESMFQKAIIATACSFALANFGPIDNWTNLGAVISGIVYGYFTRPVVDDTSRE